MSDRKTGPWGTVSKPIRAGTPLNARYAVVCHGDLLLFSWFVDCIFPIKFRD